MEAMPATVDGVSQQPAGTVRVEPGPNSAVRTLALIGSPVALVTALLLYFGWARSQAQAEAFGLDHQRPDRDHFVAVAQHQDARRNPVMAQMPDPAQAPAAGLKPVQRRGMHVFERAPGWRKGFGFGQRPKAVDMQ